MAIQLIKQTIFTVKVFIAGYISQMNQKVVQVKNFRKWTWLPGFKYAISHKYVATFKYTDKCSNMQHK